MKFIFVIIILIVSVTLQGCGKSEEEINVLLEDAYNEGWWDALDCVKREGGSAEHAAYYCEDK